MRFPWESGFFPRNQSFLVTWCSAEKNKKDTPSKTLGGLKGHSVSPGKPTNEKPNGLQVDCSRRRLKMTSI